MEEVAVNIVQSIGGGRFVEWDCMGMKQKCQWHLVLLIYDFSNLLIVVFNYFIFNFLLDLGYLGIYDLFPFRNEDF